MPRDAITVRQAVASDFELIRDLLRDGDRYHQSLGVFGMRDEPSDYDRESFAKLLASEMSAILISHNGSHALGFIRLEHVVRQQGRFHQSRQLAEVNEIVIAEAFRRSGAGAALMSAARLWSEQRHLPSLELNCFAHNGAARDFYASLGFVEHNIRFRLDLTPSKGLRS